MASTRGEDLRASPKEGPDVPSTGTQRIPGFLDERQKKPSRAAA
ncbi:hypothetical protein HMPREF9004_1501 [Schaalia cardiffensis F0333]|uniref:Uncharacterized protein n=1 Tax=Schaalia cardiffensis F0333 TaxID=888050 RepID=N6X1C9_9ACTO|nr:hypothetical protein HMPREF9004_1501 [Schaalia cardiffensis F0333]